MLATIKEANWLYVRMTVGNDSVKTNLMEIWCLELQHLVDTSSVDFIGSLANFI